MSYLMAADHPDAVASVAGLAGPLLATPDLPIHVLHVHGTNDTLVEYDYPEEGPFVFGSISDASGVSTLDFTLPDADPGDEVILLIEFAGQVDPDTFDVLDPAFEGFSLFDWSNSSQEARVSQPLVL